MADSSSFTSLFALVDSHLSKCNLQDDSKESSSDPFKLPKLNVQRGLSDTGLPSTSGLSSTSMKFPLPRMSFSERPVNNVYAMHMGSLYTPPPDGAPIETSNVIRSDSPISDVLARQLSNMFKAREAKEEEERRKQKKLMDALIVKNEEPSCLIDLMPAVQQAGQVQQQNTTALSSSSSMESIVMPDAAEIVEDDVPEPKIELPIRPPSPLLPITTDMSYILKHKIGKCSQFGKVLCARYRPVAAPYFREYVPNPKIKVFDFSTPSPDDINLERLRKPSFYNSNHAVTVYDEIMQSISDLQN